MPEQKPPTAADAQKHLNDLRTQLEKYKGKDNHNPFPQLNKISRLEEQLVDNPEDAGIIVLALNVKFEVPVVNPLKKLETLK